MTDRTHRETTLAAAVRSLKWRLGVVIALVGRNRYRGRRTVDPPALTRPARSSDRRGPS